MKYTIIIFLFFPSLIFADEKIINISDTVIKYSEKLPETLFNSMSDLSEYHRIDGVPGDSEESVKLLGITLIDMIQSKVRKSEIQRIDAISNIDLLLVLKPLPKKVDLPNSYFPRFIIQCSTFEKNEKYAMDCKQIQTEKAFGISRFDMTLLIQKNDNPANQLPTQIKIKYNVEIVKADFEKIKDKSFELMGTGSFLKLIGNLFANPKLFFKTYWEGFYDLWINS